MARVTAAEAIHALNHIGYDITRSALWQWKHRGHVSPEWGYDLDEIGEYLRKKARRHKQEA